MVPKREGESACDTHPHTDRQKASRIISPSFLPPHSIFLLPHIRLCCCFSLLAFSCFYFTFFYFYVRALVVCVLLALVSASCFASPSSRFLLVFLLKRSIHSFYVRVCIRTHTHTCVRIVVRTYGSVCVCVVRTYIWRLLGAPLP